jgi:hypothetical protein
MSAKFSRRVLVSTLSSIGAFIAFSVSAQPQGDKIDVARMTASVFPLEKDAFKTVQGKIWSDQLPQVIQNRQALVKAVPNLKLPLATESFTASIGTKDDRFVVSALNTSDCWSSSFIPNERECPARLALVNGNVKILTEVQSFPIAMVRGPAGFDASSNEKSSDRTEVLYNPANQTFSFEVFHNGESSGGPVQFFPKPKSAN